MIFCLTANQRSELGIGALIWIKLFWKHRPAYFHEYFLYKRNPQKSELDLIGSHNLNWRITILEFDARSRIVIGQFKQCTRKVSKSDANEELQFLTVFLNIIRLQSVGELGEHLENLFLDEPGHLIGFHCANISVTKPTLREVARSRKTLNPVTSE